jgi:hypothetical protein
VNILVDSLPDSIRINGKDYPVDTDFRTGIEIITAFEDPDLSDSEKAMVLTGRLYKEKPQDIQEAITKGVRFLDGGESPGDSPNDHPGMRLYSFTKDARIIYAAFRQTHGIDLQTERLHWWQFLALFMDLGAETTFSNLVNLRRKVKTGKASKEERKAAREMGDMFEIPDNDTRTLQEKIAADKFMRLLKGNG